MEGLDKIYKTKLDNIRATVQKSELLEAYLDTEEETEYKPLAEHFEPQIQELYLKVADKNPLQLEALEIELLNSEFEGLYIPKIVGYSVLRGDVTENYKYSRPQNHFRTILESIVDSANFEMISKRIGQSVQIGFALSSDIWITNFLNEITNKKVKYFLQSQKIERYRSVDHRKTGVLSYRRQFHSLNYQSAQFPDTLSDLHVLAPEVKNFLLYRAAKDYDNSSLNSHITKLIANEAFRTDDHYLELMMILGMFLDLPKNVNEEYIKAFNDMRSKKADVESKYFTYLHNLQESNQAPSIKEDKRISALIDRSIQSEISTYYSLMDTVHGKGYISEDALEGVRQYYDSHEGRSIQNECLRAAIFNYFSTFLNNLDEDAYQDYIEINKVFTQYMGIFSNQKFNQDVKSLSLKYVKRLLKKYVDKRGRDYQDIKKWVRTTFQDLGFMKDKELVELFKTRRKKKPV